MRSAACCDAAAYHFHVAHVLYEMRDLSGSIKAMRDAIRHRAAQERQGRVHFYAVLAQRQFEYGHLEAACASWGTFLDDYVTLSTARGDEHFGTMRRRIPPYRQSRAARELADRAQEVAELKA